MNPTPLALKHHGQHQAESAADMRVVALIDAVIARYAKSGREFSANDIRAEWPTTESVGLVGARVDAARKRGELRATDKRVRSTLVSTRGAWLTVWVGA